MKLFSASQIRDIDAATISELGISSTDLMERAAQACTDRLLKEYGTISSFFIFCGNGNNGGDGLAISRQLHLAGKSVSVFSLDRIDGVSTANSFMYDQLKHTCSITPATLFSAQQILQLNTDGVVIIDALLGTGTSRPTEGIMAEVINAINQLNSCVISIDLPSGMPADFFNSSYPAIRATATYTFQFPKLSCLLPSGASYVNRLELLDIGLSTNVMNGISTRFYYTTPKDLIHFMQPRETAAHKGQFGHAQIIAGSKGKSGAAVIAARACLRSGAGLLTVRTTADTASALNVAIPEAMTEVVADDAVMAIEKTDRFSVIGVGPGIGVSAATTQLMRQLLNYYQGRMVVDADAITILAENPTWLNYLPPHTILTPHVKEFSRLTRVIDDPYERLKAASDFASKYAVIIILKGTHTAIAMPDGTIHFNSSGNSGLAKGGSGDALTGILTGLIARGYNAPQAALLGVYLHGYAADLLIKELSIESILATDVAEKIPYAFKSLESLAFEEGLK
jgi:NAD(P)H-hydrate epimerase